MNRLMEWCDTTVYEGSVSRFTRGDAARFAAVLLFGAAVIMGGASGQTGAESVPQPGHTPTPAASTLRS